MNRSWTKTAKYQVVSMLMIICLASSVMANDIKRVILIETMPVPAVLESTRWFIAQLEDMGYKRGKDIILTIMQPYIKNITGKSDLM